MPVAFEVPIFTGREGLIGVRRLKGYREQTWQDRYFDRNIHGESARCEVIRYIHRNPGSPAHELCALGWKQVKRGLAASPEQYRWSSFGHYATGIPRGIEIESQWTARLRGPLIAMKPR